MTHTKTPWFHIGHMFGKTTDSGGYEVGYTSDLATGLEEAEANAAFIVRAVNAHDAMLAALKDFIGYYPAGINPNLDKAASDARSAIALAECKP